MKLVLDAGALIGLDRADRRVAGLIALARRSGAELVTTAPAVGQVWRHGPRQARLARALAMVEVHHADLVTAEAAGTLLAMTGTSDVIDALVALLAGPGDQILTSDHDELATLAAARPGPVAIVQV